MIRCTNITYAHGRSQILGMIQGPHGTLVTIGLDSKLKTWNCEKHKLKFQKQIIILSPYLHCFTRASCGLSLGKADGTLQFLNPTSYQKIKSIKLHNDLPTDLIQTSQQFISSSLDGTIAIFSKGTFQVIDAIKINFPIWKLKLFNNNLYVACSSNSFKISNFRQSNQSIITMQQKWNGFQQFQGSLYCYNQSSIKTIDQSVRIEQGCDYMKTHCGKLMVVKEEKIGLLKERNIQWWDIPELEEGYQIRNSVEIDGTIYLSGDAGNIYSIQIKEREQL